VKINGGKGINLPYCYRLRDQLDELANRGTGNDFFPILGIIKFSGLKRFSRTSIDGELSEDYR